MDLEIIKALGDILINVIQLATVIIQYKIAKDLMKKGE